MFGITPGADGAEQDPKTQIKYLESEKVALERELGETAFRFLSRRWHRKQNSFYLTLNILLTAHYKQMAREAVDNKKQVDLAARNVPFVETPRLKFRCMFYLAARGRD